MKIRLYKTPPSYYIVLASSVKINVGKVIEFHYGIRGTTLNWIQNFRTNRTQKVVVDGSSSESARMRSGVPQGTVLGPLLFLTYINDLPSTVSSQVRLFADDCLLYRLIKCRADQEQLQRDLSALQDWADRWGMCFNPSKCSVLRVSRPKSKNLEFEYTLKGETLANVLSTPYLGVCLSETLEWEAHINKITSKANSTLGFLSFPKGDCLFLPGQIVFRILFSSLGPL